MAKGFAEFLNWRGVMQVLCWCGPLLVLLVVLSKPALAYTDWCGSPNENCTMSCIEGCYTESGTCNDFQQGQEWCGCLGDIDNGMDDPNNPSPGDDCTQYPIMY